MKTTKVVLQTHTIKRTSLIENLKKHWQLFLFLILPLLYIIIFAIVIMFVHLNLVIIIFFTAHVVVNS